MREIWQYYKVGPEYVADLTKRAFEAHSFNIIYLGHYDSKNMIYKDSIIANRICKRIRIPEV